MSPTVTPTDGGNAQVKEESPELEDERILQVKTSDGTDVDLQSTCVSLFGAPPSEYPVTQGLTREQMDVRSLAAFTVRYECKKSSLSISEDTLVRQAVLRRLQQLLPDDKLSSLIDVSIDEGLLDDDGGRCATIDLVFDSPKPVLRVATGLRSIAIEGTHKEQQTFHRSALTLSLAGHIFPLDCLNLRVHDLNAEALFNALKPTFQSIGLLLGFSKLATESTRLTIELAGTRITRFYLQLHEANLSLPWVDFVHLLPTQLKINGLIHTLRYCGRHLHTKDVISPNLTVARIGEAGAQAATKHRAAPSDDSSSNAAKKRRSNK